MCDCYETKCEVKGCMEEIPVHIADFNFPRENVQVFCSKHLPKRKATIFEITKIYEWDRDNNYKVGWKCAIRLCRGEIEPKSVGVNPNIGAEEYKIHYLK